jgi:hypothetical protein
MGTEMAVIFPITKHDEPRAARIAQERFSEEVDPQYHPDPDLATLANVRDGDEEIWHLVDVPPGETIRAYLEGFAWGMGIGIPLLVLTWYLLEAL